MIKALFKLLTGEFFRFYLDGGGGDSAPAPAAPTSQTVTQTNLPEYARPYFENLMNRAQAASTGDVYQAYGGQRIAGFTPLQQQAFGAIGAMQPSAAGQAGITAATNVAQQAGQAGQYAPGTFDAQRFIDPGIASSYMSPYMQNVVDVQQREAQRQGDIARTQRQAQAAGAGAFGGSRQAIVEAEAQRNLARQLGDIQATGLQSAYQQAQQGFQTDAARQLQAQQMAEQSRQYGAGLGLQGLQQQLAAAGTLGQLGQAQYGQQMGIAAAQQQAGAQQQALQQQQLSQQYQDFLNQIRFPYQQMSFMSDILRGVPVTATTAQSLYQAPPSTSNQLMAYGLGAYGLSNLFGGKKEGGEIKAYARGGNVRADEDMLRKRMLRDAMQMPDNALMTAARQGSEIAAEALRMKRMKVGLEGMQAQAQLAQGIGALPGDVNMGEEAFADGGIVAFQAGGNRELEGSDYGMMTPRELLEGEDPSFVNRLFKELKGHGRELYPAATGQLRTARERFSGEPLSPEGLGRTAREFAQVPVAMGSDVGSMLSGAFERGKTLASGIAEPALRFGRGFIGGTEGPAQQRRSAEALAAAQNAGYTVNERGEPVSLAEVARSLPPLTEPPAPGAAGPRAAAPRAGAPSAAAQSMPAARRELPKYTERGIEGLMVSPEDQMEAVKKYAAAAGELTKPQREALEKAYKERREKVEGEKGERLSTARGLAALQAAQALTRPGQHRAAAVGAALGEAGKEAEKYVKEEAKIKDKLEEADLTMAQARLAMQQGDVKIGTDLMGKAQELRIASAKVAGERAYHQALAEAKLYGVEGDDLMHRAAAAKYEAEARILIPAHAAAYRASAAAAGQRGAVGTERIDAQLKLGAVKAAQAQFNALPPDQQRKLGPAWIQKQAGIIYQGMVEGDFGAGQTASGRIVSTLPEGEVAGSLRIPG